MGLPILIYLATVIGLCSRSTRCCWPTVSPAIFQHVRFSVGLIWVATTSMEGTEGVRLASHPLFMTAAFGITGAINHRQVKEVDTSRRSAIPSRTRSRNEQLRRRDWASCMWSISIERDSLITCSKAKNDTVQTRWPTDGWELGIKRGSIRYRQGHCRCDSRQRSSGPHRGHHSKFANSEIGLVRGANSLQRSKVLADRHSTITISAFPFQLTIDYPDLLQTFPWSCPWSWSRRRICSSRAIGCVPTHWTLSSNSTQIRQPRSQRKGVLIGNNIWGDFSGNHCFPKCYRRKYACFHLSKKADKDLSNAML